MSLVEYVVAFAGCQTMPFVIGTPTVRHLLVALNEVTLAAAETRVLDPTTFGGPVKHRERPCPGVHGAQATVCITLGGVLHHAISINLFVPPFALMSRSFYVACCMWVPGTRTRWGVFHVCMQQHYLVHHPTRHLLVPPDNRLIGKARWGEYHVCSRWHSTT